MFIFSCFVESREVSSFPTRRSSDLDDRSFGLSETQVSNAFENADALVNLTGSTQLFEEHARVPVRIYLETDPVLPQIEVRSEEHTSELQSHVNLVCRLLLEKKKTCT